MMKRFLNVFGHNTQRHHFAGFALPDVLIGSVIMSTAVAMSAQLGNSTARGMNRSNIRAKTDSAIARRMEEIRHCSFFFNSASNIKENPSATDCRDFRPNLAETLHYPEESDRTAFETACSGSLMGNELKGYLQGNTTNLLNDFNVQDYDSDAPSVAITTSATAVGNQLNVSIVASAIPLRVESTIVPHAQGWCK